MNITREQAQEWLDGAIPGPWEASFDEVYCATRLYAWGEGDEIEDGDSWELARHAPDLAQTIAGMEWQWGLERDYRCGTETDTVWFPSEDEAREDLSNPHRQHGNPRLVRRLVGPVEEAE